MTKTLDFTVSISYADNAAIDPAELQRLVNAAVLDAIPDLGDPAPVVDTVPGGIPKVLVVVKDGAAEIRAVTGTADVALVDLDREGAILDEEEIEDILEFDRHTDDGQAKLTSELEDARTALLAYTETDPAP